MKSFIARDKDGGLYIYFGRKPHKEKYAWTLYSSEPDDFKKIPDKDLFTEVKWEDEEPTEVSIEIVGKKAQQPQEQRQPQTKFDPKTLKPLDKVLVRNDNDTWQVEFFSHICKHEPKGWCQCSGDSYYFCIPYNNDTKHLVGTMEEAPDFYVYWEE